MNKRDVEILESLRKFRVLDRDQLISMHFQGNADSIQSCNKVMKRLSRDKRVEVDPGARPYNYFPDGSAMKKNSTKIPHFKAIGDFYIDISTVLRPKVFEVEYKTGSKGSVEPDIYMIWNKIPFFVEIQRNIYSKKVMERKLERYKDYYSSGLWKERMKFFPYLWIITEHVYLLNFEPLKVYQTKTVNEMINTYMVKQGAG
ncbi:replication-relaxation family protein [Metabacillus sp. FJAT-52054]|uniref:Replication-relaxation family protein n=1 Tax=Metabacillus sediminis TaxID=3117746 RepID=A0ABZ2NPB9_9BACI